MTRCGFLLLGLGLFANSLCYGALTSISIPKESQDFQKPDHYPARDNIWAVTIPPYPFNAEAGIGRLIGSSALGLEADVAEPTRLFALHSTRFAADYIPVSSAVVTYAFDVPTTVAELEVIQHQNGIARVEGFAGNQLNAMTSIGNVFGPRGDVRGGGIFTEGESTVFQFPGRIAATLFQFRISQTSLAREYAIYRAFPRNEHGQRFLPAGDALAKARVSEIEISWWSLPGESYNVEYSTEADATVWLPLSSNLAGTGGELSVTDRPPKYGAKRFYRVVPAAP